MDKMNILITTAEWKNALICMRSLAKIGHKITLLSSSPYTPSLYSKFCSERIVTPSEKDKKAYLEFTLRLLQKNNHDVVIPISDLCIEYFNEKRDEVSKYAKMLLPPKEGPTSIINKINR